MWIFILRTILTEIFFIPRRIKRGIVIMFVGRHKVTVILVRFSVKLEFSRLVFDKSSATKFYEIPYDASGVVLRRQTG